jgi:FKBP-type peptidyl-prolyl cis-trans isomerase FkpA
MTQRFLVIPFVLALSAYGAHAFATETETLPSGVKIVHYRGTLADGKEFDSSYKRNEPAVFPLNRVVPCWTQGLQKIKVGGKATLTCPPATAYGERGAGGAVPPNATLTFDVELLAIEK